MGTAFNELIDNGISQFSAGVDAVTTTWNVKNGAKYPSAFPYVVTGYKTNPNALNEKVLVTNRVGNVLTVTRAFDGSTAQAHAADDNIGLFLTTTHMELVQDSIIGIEDGTTTLLSVTTSGDLIVDGGNIGLTADPDLLTLAANLLTVNGDLTLTGDLLVDGLNIGITSDPDLLVLGLNQLLVNGAIIATTTLSSTAGLTANSGGGNNDSQIKGLTDDNLFFVDAGNDRIGINNATPQVLFHVGPTNIDVDFLSGDKDVIFDGGIDGRIYVQGSSSAALGLIDSGAGANVKFVQILTDGGEFRVRSINDAGGGIFNMMTLAHSNGNAVFGGDLQLDGDFQLDGSVDIGTGGGAAPSVNGDDLVILGSGAVQIGLTLSAGASNVGHIYFGDAASSTIGEIRYTHASDNMHFFVAGSQALLFDSSLKAAFAGEVRIEDDLAVNAHIITDGTIPTVLVNVTTMNAGAGTGAAMTILAGSTDTAGSVTLTAGDGTPTAGKVGTVTFISAYGSAPAAVMLTRGINQGDADRGFFVGALSSTAFEIHCDVAFLDTSVIDLYYTVIGK